MGLNPGLRKVVWLCFFDFKILPLQKKKGVCLFLWYKFWFEYYTYFFTLTLLSFNNIFEPVLSELDFNTPSYFNKMLKIMITHITFIRLHAIQLYRQLAALNPIQLLWSILSIFFQSLIHFCLVDDDDDDDVTFVCYCSIVGRIQISGKFTFWIFDTSSHKWFEFYIIFWFSISHILEIESKEYYKYAEWTT